jgi:hypothetical protein
MNEKKDLDEVKNLIQDNGEVPKEDIGDLGEQFTKALFKGFIRRHGTPDYTITLNRKDFILETTVIDKIYRNPLKIFYDVCKEIGNKKLAADYGISVDPSNLHESDEGTFKEELNGIITNIQNRRPKYQKFTINGRTRNYTVTFERRNTDSTKLCLGEIYRPASNLTHTLTKKMRNKQIPNSDILLLIILNDLVEKGEELLDELYRQIGFGINFLGEGPINKFITQYCLEETVWFNTRLKCVIAVYPVGKNVVICPSLCYYEEFSAIEYAILRSVIEDKGFEVEFVVHSSDINEIKRSERVSLNHIHQP